MELTQEQHNEVCEFQKDLNRLDEWLFWNICALKAIEEGRAVTYEDKYRIMKKWDFIMEQK